MNYLKKLAIYRLFQRLRWHIRARHLPFDTIKVRTTKGEFSLNARSWQVAPLIAQYGKGKELDYEKEESKKFESLIKEGDMVFDIGAQVGYYTLLALHAGAGRVYAFEMIHDYANEVQRQAKMSGREKQVEIVEQPLGKRDGEQVVFQNYFKKGEGISTTLDTFIKERGVRPDVIKIDVQGNEISVLEGAREVLKKDRPKLMVMIYEELLKERGEKKEEGIEIIRQAGYVVEQFANEHSYICFPKKSE